MASGELPLSYDGNNIAFIVGCQRSGTTWLQRLLATHPLVFTGQESEVFSSYLGPMLRRWEHEPATLSGGYGYRGPGMRNYLEEEEFVEILRKTMLKFLTPMVGGLGRGELFIEKTPSHALYINEISKLLPQSKFIHILRDGRDVTASLLAASRDWGRDWAPHSSRAASRRWVTYVEAVRDSAKHLAPDRFYEIRYESLLESPEKELGMLVRFLSLDWAIEDIRKAVARNAANNPQTGWTPIPRMGDFSQRVGHEVKEIPSFTRRATSGNWKKDLNWTGKMWFWLIARNTMRKVGYRCDYPW